MQNLEIKTNLEEFRLNEKVSVFYNPSDPNFIGRIFDAFTEFNNKTEEYHEKIDGASVEDVVALGKELDADMRKRFIEIFGEDIITPLIGNMSVYAVADGLPIWANLLLAIIDTMEGVDAEQRKKGNERIAAYTKKYAVKDHQKKGGRK